MDVNLRVEGFKPPDEKWKKMKAVHDACLRAGVVVPEEVMEYFEGKSPDPKGVEVKLQNLKPWARDMEDGFEIDINTLPADVKILRFVCSYN